VLRQALDVIMVGEVRDPVTAETAVRAANSGHLVLATMHAPTAGGAVPALLNLGVHPHYLASSLLGAIAQRLVRTLCNECKISYELGESAPTFDEVRRFLEPGQGQTLYGPKGCPACRMEGFAGRTGVFEMLTVTPALRKLILDRPTQQDLRRQAAHDGLIEFRQAALLKVAQGVTSVEEVFRAVPTEFLGKEG
jgi:type II secretory ATPase GspE/PulE/Tfp pilus assembly ATPase PilB-like protein